MADQIDFSKYPKIKHEVKDSDLEDLLALPHAKFTQTELLMGMSQLKACMMKPLINEKQQFQDWETDKDYQFKLVISPNRKVIRLEVYDTQLFPLILEQLLQKGYAIKSSGEDVELATLKQKNNAWLGWAHLVQN